MKNLNNVHSFNVTIYPHIKFHEPGFCTSEVSEDHILAQGCRVNLKTRTDLQTNKNTYK